jgi:hypothetical protein
LINGNYPELVAFRCSSHLKEEMNTATSAMGIADSEFIRRAITSALIKFAQRTSSQSAEIAEGMPMGSYDDLPTGWAT